LGHSRRWYKQRSGFSLIRLQSIRREAGIRCNP
jgi:hypothetical protein